MARKRANQAPRAKGAGPAGYVGPQLDPNENPIGQSPFGGTPYNPSDLHGNLIAQFAPIAQTVMGTENDIKTHIISQLAHAENTVNVAESAVKLGIATQLTPSHLAIGTVHQAITSKIRLGLNMGAEAASTGMQSPVLLSHAVIDPVSMASVQTTTQSQPYPQPVSGAPVILGPNPTLQTYQTPNPIANGAGPVQVLPTSPVLPTPIPSAPSGGVASGLLSPGDCLTLNAIGVYAPPIGFMAANVQYPADSPSYGGGTPVSVTTDGSYIYDQPFQAVVPQSQSDGTYTVMFQHTYAINNPQNLGNFATPVGYVPTGYTPAYCPDFPASSAYPLILGVPCIESPNAPPSNPITVSQPVLPNPTPTPTPTPIVTRTDCCCGQDQDHPCYTKIVCNQADDYGIFIGRYEANALVNESGMVPSVCYTGTPEINIKPGLVWNAPTIGPTGPVNGTPTPVGNLAASFGVRATATGVSPGITNPPLEPGDPAGTCTLPFQITLVDAGTGISDVFPNLNTVGDTMKTYIDKASKANGIIFWATLAPIGALLDWFISIWVAVFSGIATLLKGVNASIANTSFNEAIINILNTVCLGSLRKYKRAITYDSDVKNPIGIMSADQAASAFLANEIDACTFKTYVCANDVIYDAYLPLVKAGKLKFSALELQQLYMRQGIKRGNLSDRLRELGSLHEEDVDELDCLTTQIPGPSDIIRMMVRDVVNPTVVSTFNLDSGFEDNYQDVLKSWAGNQGLPDQAVQMYWRAHWDIPSPTQLYEILRRLRHDPAFFGDGNVADNVETALKQQDILPFWIPYLMKIAYHPMTRTDLNRAYSHGWIGDDDYVDGIYQDGYSDDDAQTLLRFAKSERTLAIRGLAEVQDYRKGFMSIAQLQTALQALDYSPDVVVIALQIADTYRDLDNQEAILRKLDQAYRMCRIDDNEYTQSGMAAGIDPGLLAYRLNINSYYTTCGARHESVAALCQALDQNMITPQEYLDRAKILKFDDIAAQRYLDLCQNAKASRQAKAILKQQQQAQKDAEKALKQQQQAQKQQQSQADKIIAQAAKNQRAKIARNRILEDASAKYAAVVGVDGQTASAVVGTVYEQIQNAYGLSQTEAANAVNLTTTQKKFTDAPSFTAMAEGVALAALSDPYILFPGAPILNEG